MAIFRFEAKPGKNSGHFDYIMREEKYKKRKDLEYRNEFNVPKEFKNAKDFFESAFIYERKNANIYREYLITLPNEFTKEENIEMAERFLKNIFKDNYVYAYAFHSGHNSENSHIHCMFSERKLDGISREKEKFFSRYNSKNPEKGGAFKEWNIFHKKEFLKDLRKKWEVHLNKYLESKGIEKVSCENNIKQQKIAIENEEYLKAEILKRKKYSRNKYKDIDSYKDYENEIKMDKEITNNVLREFKKEIFKNQKKKYSNKNFKEILNLKEKLETEIFKLNKKLEDKNITNLAENNLTNRKINNIKNEKRKLYKEAKILYKDINVRNYNNKKNFNYNENVKKYIQIKDELKVLDNKINKLKLSIDSDKLIDEKLKIKANYMKQFEKIKLDYEIINSIFLEKVKSINKNSDDELLYKLYIEKLNFKELRKEIRGKFYENKKKITKELPEYKKTKSKISEEKIKNYKLENFKIIKKESILSKISNQLKREIEAKNYLNKHTEFILKDISEIIEELENENYYER